MIKLKQMDSRLEKELPIEIQIIRKFYFETISPRVKKQTT